MVRYAIGLVLVLLLAAFAGEARAWTPFGTVEHTTPIEDVALTTPEGDALYLGYKTSTVYFLLGVYFRDDGYVLGLRSSPKHIGEMPPPDVLAELQKQGKLPNPLPPYRLGIGDYIMGFSLWIIALPLAGIYMATHFSVRSRRPRRRLPRH